MRDSGRLRIDHQPGAAAVALECFEEAAALAPKLSNYAGDCYRRSIPWHLSELMLVDGLPCVYTAHPRDREGAIVVHRHGR